MNFKNILLGVLLTLFLISSILGFTAVFDDQWIRSSVLFFYGIALLFFIIKLVKAK